MIDNNKSVLWGLIKLMRLKHWVKNSFVLAPLMFTGLFLDVNAVSQSLLAFLFFCLASSATYILNDIKDIEHDRQHPEKSKSRPLASGVVTIPQATNFLLVLYAVLIFGYFLLPSVAMVILAYLVLNIAYTFALKHQPVIDIFTIAIGFVLRVYAGAVALEVPVSSWMFVTTLSLALYLASVKRRQEIALSGKQGRKVLKHYTVSLIDRYAEMSATGTLLFYSMYVMSTNQGMVITIPLVLYGLFRYWFLVESLEGGESPTDALFRDWQLLLTIVLWVVASAWIMRPV